VPLHQRPQRHFGVGEGPLHVGDATVRADLAIVLGAHRALDLVVFERPDPRHRHFFAVHSAISFSVAAVSTASLLALPSFTALLAVAIASLVLPSLACIFASRLRFWKFSWMESDLRSQALVSSGLPALLSKQKLAARNGVPQSSDLSFPISSR